MEANHSPSHTPLAAISKLMPGVLIQLKCSEQSWQISYLGDGCDTLLGSNPTSKDLKTFLLELTDKNQSHSILNQLDLIKTSSQTHRIPFQIKSKKCKGNWIELYLNFQQDQNTTILANGVMLDCSDQKGFELELEKNANILKAAIESSPAAILIAEAPNVNILVANPAALGTRGGEKETLIDIDVAEHMKKWQTYHLDGSPYDPMDLPLSRAVIKGETTLSKELIIRDEHQNDHYIIANASPVFNSKGEIEMGVVMWNDITDLKNSEREKLMEKKRLEFAMNAGKMGSWEITFSDDKIRWFGNTKQIFDRDEKGLPNTVTEFIRTIHEEEQDYLKAEIQKSFLAGSEFSVDHRIFDSKNEIRWLKAIGQVFQNDEGKSVKMSGIVFDITDIRKTEQQLKKLTENLEKIVIERTRKLENANEELKSFAYSVSHDLRSPLRSIDGFSQILKEDYENQLDDTGKEYLNRIRNASNRMAELIDDILKLSQINSKELQLKTVDISHLSEDVFNHFHIEKTNRDVSFSVEPDIKIEGDYQLIRLIVENLISNALKYTSYKNKAIIQIMSNQADDHFEWIIKDNGVGFNMQNMEKLFAPFQRLHSKTEFPGIGIGLSTVKRIVNKHGWNITAVSEEGRGATFTIEIPLTNKKNPEI